MTGSWDEGFGIYREAQVHKGVAPEDIESVIFTKEPSPVLQSRMGELGISWSVR